MVQLNRETTGEDIVATYGGNATGKTFLLTGPSDGGLGAELLITLAKAAPAHYILAGRNQAKVAPVIEKINAANSNIKTTFIALDLLDNSSVHRAATEVLASTDHIDVLINNAGVAAKREFQLSKDGVEAHFAANYLGHFLFTNLIAELLVKVKATVLNVTSMAYGLAETNSDDINFDKSNAYSPWVAYARSKTANILFSYALAEKYPGKLTPFATDPGLAHESKLAANNDIDEAMMADGYKLFKERAQGRELPVTVVVTMQQGIASALLAALNPELSEKAPAFVKESQITPALPYATDKDEALKLWAVSEKLVGQKFPA